MIAAALFILACFGGAIIILLIANAMWGGS